VVDAHSKWLKVMVVPSTSFHVTIQKLSTIFATHGLWFDNATSFTSSGIFGIHHISSAPYHPATNGLAEIAVQTFKEGMKTISEGDIETRIARFLFHYCNTPYSTTGVSPAEMLLKGQPRSHLNITRPNISHIQSKQLQQHQLGRTTGIYIRVFGVINMSAKYAAIRHFHMKYEPSTCFVNNAW
jgi:hypothetical protein